jgi:hypothetical protein
MLIFAIAFLLLLSWSAIALLIWIFSGDINFGKILGYTWLTFFCLFFLGYVFKILTDKKDLDKNDYYGDYVINRDYFSGEQSDWQYETYRFTITESDSIFFYVTDKEKVLKTYKGVIKTNHYKSVRLIVNMDEPTHHIMMSNPTTYRSAWSFYLVFNSPKFNNVYFKKGKWKPLN